MILFNNYLDTLVILFIYMFIYNISLIMIFWTLHQFISFNFKTLYSFTDLKFNYYFTTILSIVLFSMAGVPPFLGFFSKILILILLINSNFFLFYIFFFWSFIFWLIFLSSKYSFFTFYWYRKIKLRKYWFFTSIVTLLRSNYFFFIYYTFWIFIYGWLYFVFLLIIKLKI